MSDEWFTFRAAAESANNMPEIEIYQQIGGDPYDYGYATSAKKFAKELKALGDVDDIAVYLNSPGGEVFEGQAIHTLLANHKAKIHVRVDGLAASIASVIMMAGDEISIPKNAMVMIHRASGIAFGDASSMRETANTLEKIEGSIRQAYMRHVDIDEDKLTEMMNEETWMTGEEAVELGFAHVLLESAPITNRFDISAMKFRNTPETLLEVPEDAVKAQIDAMQKRMGELEQKIAPVNEEDAETPNLDAYNKKFTEMMTRKIQANRRLDGLQQIEDYRKAAQVS